MRLKGFNSSRQDMTTVVVCQPGQVLPLVVAVCVVHLCAECCIVVPTLNTALPSLSVLGSEINPLPHPIPSYMMSCPSTLHELLITKTTTFHLLNTDL